MKSMPTYGRKLMLIGALAPIAMLAPIIASFFASDYSWLAQHMSELQLRKDGFSVTVHVGAFSAGIALFCFAVGALLCGGLFTALTTFAFALGMLTNGIYPMGTPMHGLYGIAIFLILPPLIFVGEFTRISQPRWFRTYSYVTAILSLGYMWALLVGLDPEGWSGLTQRLATLVSFSWYAIAAQRIHAVYS